MLVEKPLKLEQLKETFLKLEQIFPEAAKPLFGLMPLFDSLYWNLTLC
jgi:hypothetical protein